MRIDAHQHFWHYDPVRDSWINEKMAVLKRDFLPPELIQRMREAGIDRSIAVQADQSEKETKFLLDVAEDNEAIAGVVGWIDLLDGNIERRLEYFSEYQKLRGFRHIVQAEPDDRFMMRKDFLHGISCLARMPSSAPWRMMNTSDAPPRDWPKSCRPQACSSTSNAWRTSTNSARSAFTRGGYERFV